MIQKYQSGKKVTPRKRKGNVVQPSGKVSTHKMAREYVEGRGWVAFPTLFQDDNGKWYDLSGSKNWEEVYEFAKNRGEVYDFGEDVQAAIEFADIGSSWKKDMSMNKKVKKYQSGGAPSLEDILGGNFSFANLFGNLGNVTNINQSYSHNGQEMSEEDYLRATYQNEIDSENPQKNLKWWEYGLAAVQPGYTGWRLGQEWMKKRKRKKGYEQLEEDIASGDIYDSDETQGILADARLANMQEYMQGDEFKSGLQSMGTQFADIQKQMKAERFNQPVDHKPFMVGGDRGIRKYQDGGQVSIPHKYLSLFSGNTIESLADYATAVKEHESYTDYQRLEDKGRPGRGGYQFKPSRLITAAKKAKRLHEEWGGGDVPEVYSDIIKGEIKDATQLSPEIQDELFYSSMFNFVPVKDKNGKTKNYRLEVNPKVLEYNIATPGGMASLWQKVHNKGSKDRIPKFMESLKRTNLFKKQAGGPINPFMNPGFMAKYSRAENGDVIVGGDGNQYTKGSDSIQPSLLGYKDSSPDRFNRMNRIPGGNITMDDVSIPLLLKPNKGKPMVALPNSGNYKFPGADYVDEIPLRNYGGMTKKYQQGGEPKQSIAKAAVSFPGWFAQSMFNVATRGGEDSPVPYDLKLENGQQFSWTPDNSSLSQYIINRRYSAIPRDPQMDRYLSNLKETNPKWVKKNLAKYQQGGSPSGDMEMLAQFNALLSMLGGESNNTPDIVQEYIKERIAGSSSRREKMAKKEDKAKSQTKFSAEKPKKTSKKKIPKGDFEVYDPDTEIIDETLSAPMLDFQKGDALYRLMMNNYNMPVPQAQEGGQVDPNQPVPIQAEKGEMVMFQDGTVTPVKAKKRHKRMKDDEVTDVLPPGSYVFSNDKNLKIDKKLADEISFGFGPTVYSENEINEAPREMFFGEVFKKKQETPASVAKNIKRKYPVTDLENDIYAERAKVENRMSRMPYLAMLKQINDAKRGDTGPSQMMQYGGQTMSPMLQRTMPPQVPQAPMPRIDNNIKPIQGIKPVPSPRMIPKAQTGMEAMMIGGIGDAIGGIASAFQNYYAQQRVKRNQAQTEQDLEDFYGRATGRAQQQLGVEAGSAFAQMALQDPTYSRMNLDAVRSRTQNAFTDLEQELQAQQQLTGNMQQAPINSAYRNMAGADPRMAAANADAMYAQYLKNSNASALGYADRLSGARLQGMDALNKIDLMDIQDKQRGDMYEKASRNMLGAGLAKGLGAAGTTYFSRLGQADLTQVAGKMGARNQTIGALNNLTALQNQNFKDIGAGIGDATTGIYNQWNSQNPDYLADDWPTANINDYNPSGWNDPTSPWGGIGGSGSGR